MPNKHPTAIGVAGEQPPISIGSTAVNLSRPNGHRGLLQSFVMMGSGFESLAAPVKSLWLSHFLRALVACSTLRDHAGDQMVTKVS